MTQLVHVSFVVLKYFSLLRVYHRGKRDGITFTHFVSHSKKYVYILCKVYNPVFRT